MEAVQETLRERYTAWVEAREIAESDPTVNVGAGSAQYEVPQDMVRDASVVCMVCLANRMSSTRSTSWKVWKRLRLRRSPKRLLM